MTIDLIGALTTVISDRASVTATGAGRIITLPWSLGDGESVAVSVTEVGDDLFALTDRGLAADSLALAGVDLSASAAWASFQAVQRSIGLAPSVMSEVSRWELTASASSAEIGLALTQIGEAVLRADALRALGRSKRSPSFDDRVIRRANEHDLVVVPKAPLDMREGGQRRVTCRVQSGHNDPIFVQALAPHGSDHRAYDHVRSVFGDAAAPRASLVTLVDDGARLVSWQRNALESLSRVVSEAGQDEVWRNLTAAERSPA